MCQGNAKVANYNFAELGLTLLCSYLHDLALQEMHLSLNHEQQNAARAMQKYQLVATNLMNYLINNGLQDFRQIKPSFVCGQFLHCYEWELILWFCRGSKLMRQIIWRYLSQWQFVKSPLNGKDLQELGYPADKNLGKILGQLRNLYLDQVIDSPQSARLWLNEQRRELSNL